VRTLPDLTGPAPEAAIGNDDDGVRICLVAAISDTSCATGRVKKCS
jgi:hypothetical protein